MAKKISELPNTGTALIGTELVPIVQGGITKRVPSNLFTIPADLASPASGKGADLVAKAVRQFATTATMSAMPASAIAVDAFVEEEGRGGNFYYVPGSAQTVDNVLVFTANTGRWFREGWTVLGFNGDIQVRWAGAAGDGTTDDTAAFTTALGALGTRGGVIHYHNKHLIDSNLTIPASCAIKGPHEFVGSPGTNASAPYGNMAALIVNSAATITLMGGAGLSGCLVYRKGMTFPAADSSAFAGTAITAGADDCFIAQSMILGFNKAYYSTGKQRPRLQNVYIDCVNGIEVDNCADISRINGNHCWPFATITAAGPASSLQRTGTAYKFTTLGDWNQLIGCFCYGYQNGFVNTSCNSMTYLACAADSTGGMAGQRGFTVDGGSTDTRLNMCQAANQAIGYYINCSTLPQQQHTRMSNCDSWSASAHGVQIDAGDVAILGGTHRNTANAITINNAASVVEIDYVRFRAVSGAEINFAVTNPNVSIGEHNDYGDLAAGNSVVGGTFAPIQLTAADPLNLPPNGEVFQVTGNTNIGTINGGWAKRRVTLLFTGTPTVFAGGAIKLPGGANFVATNFDLLELIHDGTNWITVAAQNNA